MAKKESHRRNFVRVPVFRRATGDDGLPKTNGRGQPLPDSDPLTWQHFKFIYVCVTAVSSNEIVFNHQQQPITNYRIEITKTHGLDSSMKILWQGVWLQFNGNPIPTSKRCRNLVVRGIECDPCKVPVSKCQSGCNCGR